uniref:RNA polymerase II subunit B1 CTD phosphatase RPAP2 homolog n=1 Tax=Anopheles minimus TaxID=112268 RepID=A0A182WHD5_9DIPT
MQCRMSEDDPLPQTICEQCHLELEIVSNFRDRLLTSDKLLRTLSVLGDGVNNEETLVDESISSCPATTATLESMEQESAAIELAASSCGDCKKKIYDTEPTYLFQHSSPTSGISNKVLCQECYQRIPAGRGEGQVEGNCSEAILVTPTLTVDQLPLEPSNAGMKSYRFCCVTHCSEKFANEEALLKHTRQMHTIKIRKNRENQEPGRPFKCNICFRAFTSSKNLRVHQLVRSNVHYRNFTCNTCPFRAGSIAALTVHERSHTGERPFQCDSCEKRFYSETLLKSHLVCHRDERPFECSHYFNVFKSDQTPKVPATKVNRTNLPRRARNFSKEQLQKALRKKKECNDKAQRTVETLIEPGRTEEELLTLLKDINQCHMEDIIEERAIGKLCGYPLCDNALTNIPKQKYVISASKNKVYDITERKNFCSGDCYKASNFIKQQMLTSPLWLRDQEDIPNFRLLNGRQLIYRETDVKKPLQPEELLFGELKIVERTYAPNEQEEILGKKLQLVDRSTDQIERPGTAAQDVEEELDSTQPPVMQLG